MQESPSGVYHVHEVGRTATTPLVHGYVKLFVLAHKFFVFADGTVTLRAHSAERRLEISGEG